MNTLDSRPNIILHRKVLFENSELRVNTLNPFYFKMTRAVKIQYYKNL